MSNRLFSVYLMNQIFQTSVPFKGALSGMRQFLATESPSHMIKNAFHLTLKVIFVLKIFKFLIWLFGHVPANLMKTSWRCLEDVFGLRLQKTSSRRLDQDEYIRLTHTSSEDVFKTFPRCLQDIFKTSSRCFENVFKTSSRHLQDVFKTYYHVKLFLVSQF